MKITFTDYQEWLDELLFVCDNAPNMRPDLIRLSKEKVPEKDSKGHEYNSIILCGSFVFDGLPYEVFVDCGVEYTSFRGGEGEQEYDRISSEIINHCDAIGLPVRKGRLVFEL